MSINMKDRIIYLKRNIKMLKEDMVVFWDTEEDRARLKNYKDELEELSYLK